jgi:integrase
LLLALGYFTGAREGEILGLRWEQVHLLSGIIRLWAGETKSDEGRSIPVIPQLRVMLVAQRVRRQEQWPYVCFRLDRCGHAVKIGGFRNAWQSACTRAGLGKLEPALDAADGEPL